MDCTFENAMDALERCYFGYGCENCKLHNSLMIECKDALLVLAMHTLELQQERIKYLESQISTK